MAAIVPAVGVSRSVAAPSQENCDASTSSKRTERRASRVWLFIVGEMLVVPRRSSSTVKAACTEPGLCTSRSVRHREPPYPWTCAAAGRYRGALDDVTAGATWTGSPVRLSITEAYAR